MAPPLRRWKRAGRSANRYDKVGRLTKRQDYGSNATDNWTYGATNSAGTLCDGQLARESTSGGYSVTYSYDGLCRETNRSYAGTSGSFATAYDQTTGRVSSITYPSGVVASFGYSGGNYPNETLVATGGASAHLFSEILTANAALQPMTGTTGDGVGTVWNWDGDNRLSDITSGPSGSTNSVQNLGYQYDGLGNVTYRRDSVTGLAENFTYDAKNQLTASYLNGDTTGKAFAYDALGNLTYRSDLGILTYGYTGKPHTLASIQVDPNSPYAGTIGTIESNSYSWTWFNKVSEATVGGDSFQYEYDNRHQRYTQYDSAWSRTTTYLRGPGGTEEDIVGAVIHDLIPGVGGIAGEVVNNGANLLYYHKDQLGSVTAVSGGNSEVDSYDAWGKRRMTNGGDDTTCYVSSVAIRGYITEEQNAPSCPLINLNARMYDPITTRFLSPDPKGLAAGPNPYAYAANNPLTYKDPTGLDCIDEGCHGLPPLAPPTSIICFSSSCGGWNGFDPSGGLLPGVSSPAISGASVSSGQVDQSGSSTPPSDNLNGNNGCGPGPTVCAAAGGLPAVGVGFLDTEALAAATAAATGTATEAATLSGAVIAAAPLIAVAGVVNAVIGSSTSLTDQCDQWGSCNQFIVRGGTNFAIQFTNGSGVTTDADGNLQGVSVQSFPNTSIQELSQRIWVPQNQIGVIQMDQLPPGAYVVPDGSLFNPYHALMGGLTADQAQALFQPTMLNPNPKISP